MLKLLQPKSPLHDLICAVRQRDVQQAVESKIGQADCLPTAVYLVTALTAGHFLTTSGEPMRARLRASRDVFAFETLAFCTFAVRDAYRDPGPTLEKGFNIAMRAADAVVAKQTNWECGDLFLNRVIGYHGPGVGAFDPAAHFRMLLLSIGREKTPRGKYGPPSLDLKAQTLSLASVGSFAATMPSGSAETLRNIVNHFGLDR